MISAITPGTSACILRTMSFLEDLCLTRLPNSIALVPQRQCSRRAFKKLARNESTLMPFVRLQPGRELFAHQAARTKRLLNVAGCFSRWPHKRPVSVYRPAAQPFSPRISLERRSQDNPPTAKPA